MGSSSSKVDKSQKGKQASTGSKPTAKSAPKSLTKQPAASKQSAKPAAKSSTKKPAVSKPAASKTAKSKAVVAKPAASKTPASQPALPSIQVLNKIVPVSQPPPSIEIRLPEESGGGSNTVTRVASFTYISSSHPTFPHGIHDPQNYYLGHYSEFETRHVDRTSSDSLQRPGITHIRLYHCLQDFHHLCTILASPRIINHPILRESLRGTKVLIHSLSEPLRRAGRGFEVLRFY